MRYTKHEFDKGVRHIVSFTEEEVMAILHDYAQGEGQGLPSPPAFISYPLHDPAPRNVKIGVDVVE